MQEKSNILDNIRKRIIYIADNQSESRDLFLIKTGLKKGIFDKKDIDRAVGSDTISNILDSIPEISAEWLVSGKGPMLKHLYDTQNTPIYINEPSEEYVNGYKIPLVSNCAVAGFSSTNFAIEEKDVKDYYVVPKFKDRKIDFMIEVSGSSMYPKYNSGDIVACRIITDSNFIQWNKVHVLATMHQGILLKRIRKSLEPNCLLAVSDNSIYDPFDVPNDEITGIAIVVGVIRLE